MGFLDRFKSKWQQRQKGAQPKHAVSKKDQDDEAKRAAFRAVGSVGAAPKTGGDKAASSDRKTSQPGGKAGAPKRPKKQDTGPAYRWLVRPLVTEKSTRLSSRNQYVFEVRKSANKLEVRKAVKALYGVNARRINIQNLSGKDIRYGRTQGRTRDWKKAIVSLEAGQKIDPIES